MPEISTKGNSMHCALITNALVVNVIVAEDDFIQSISSEYEAIVPLDRPGSPVITAGIGWSYNAGVFTPPAAHTEPAAPADTKITVFAFRSRFTREEKANIELAALDNPSAPMAQRQQAAALRSDLKDQASATYIDLNDPTLIEGTNALESAGLLAAGRANTILTAAIQPSERP